MEENRSEDIGCDVVRIYDTDPRKQWPIPTSSVVLGGYPLMRMPFVGDDRSRPQCLEDGVSPITWYITFGSVRQQKDVEGVDRRRNPVVSLSGGCGRGRLQAGLSGGD